jgi:hypothetical protein
MMPRPIVRRQSKADRPAQRPSDARLCEPRQMQNFEQVSDERAGAIKSDYVHREDLRGSKAGERVQRSCWRCEAHDSPLTIRIERWSCLTPQLSCKGVQQSAAGGRIQ